MGDEDRNDIRVPPSIGLDRRPDPSNSEMIDDYGVPIPNHLHAQRAAEWYSIILARYIRKAAKEAPNRKTPTYSSVPVRGNDDPFDSVVACTWSGAAGTAHRQDGKLSASLAEAPYKMGAVHQVAGIRRQRINPCEPKAPQGLPSDLLQSRTSFFTITIRLADITRFCFHRGRCRPARG